LELQNIIFHGHVHANDITTYQMRSRACLLVIQYDSKIFRQIFNFFVGHALH